MTTIQSLWHKVRCPHCQHLLLEIDFGRTRVKCRFCKHLVVVTLQESEPTGQLNLAIEGKA